MQQNSNVNSVPGKQETNPSREINKKRVIDGLLLMQINSDEEGRSGISTETHIDISSVLSLKVNEMKQIEEE